MRQLQVFYNRESCYDYIRSLESENKGKRGRALRYSWIVNYFPTKEQYIVESWLSTRHKHYETIL